MSVDRDFTVKKYGRDSSGRPVFMTVYMRSVWLMILRDPRVVPFAHKLVIVQGAFMSRVKGGGAEDSSGFHNKAGCADVRTYNLTDPELDTFIEVARDYGWAFWRRDQKPEHGGMDEHAHGVLGTDQPLTAGAESQWSGPNGYLKGGNGLAHHGPDYEKRPKPLVKAPPEDPMKALFNDLMKVCKKHGVSGLWGARVLLWGITPSNTGGRLKVILKMRAAGKGAR